MTYDSKTKNEVTDKIYMTRRRLISKLNLNLNNLKTSKFYAYCVKASLGGLSF